VRVSGKVNPFWAAKTMILITFLIWLNIRGSIFIKICQNTPQLFWGDEWPTLSPGGRGLAPWSNTKYSTG
jgi:hypothetical protein